MKTLSVLAFVLMSALSVASDEVTMNSDELLRVRTFLDGNSPIDRDVRLARTKDSLRQQAQDKQWAPITVLGMFDVLELFQPWLAAPLCNVLMVVASNADISRIGYIRMATFLERTFEHLIVDKWKLLSSEKFDASILVDDSNADDMKELKDEIGGRLVSIARAHATATHGYTWKLNDHICFLKALGEAAPGNLDEVVKTYQTIAQGNKGNVDAHASIVKILSSLSSPELANVRSAYQTISSRFGYYFQLHLLRDAMESYPYLSLEEWEAKLDAITIRDESIEYDLYKIEPIVKSLAAAQVDLSCIAEVVSRYYCNNSLSAIGRLIKAFAKIDDKSMRSVARAGMLLFNSDTSMIHFQGIVDAFNELPVEKIDPITRAIVITKTKEIPSRDLYYGTYKHIIKALLGLPDAYLIPVANRIAYLAKHRRFDEDQEIQIVKELSGLPLDQIIEVIK